MSKKNKQQIKFEADITGLKKGIKEGEESIRSLTKELKLNQEQLKGNKDNTDLLTKKLNTLQDVYEQQKKVVEQTNEAYQEAVKQLGENSEEAKKWKDKLVEAETKQQKIKNAIDETNKELKTQTDRLITNGKKWEETGENITKLGDKINSLGNKLSVVSAGIAAIATASLKASIDYESAFAGVEKTVDATEEQLAKLKTGILEMSTRMPAAATEIAGVAEAAGQLGIQTDNILNFSEAMIGLGESTNLTSTEAATQLARFANIMQMSQDDFDKLGSSIVDLGNNFATTEADIVNMAMRLAGAGKQVGLSEGQVLGLSAALSSVGVEAEMGGSAISKAMVKMQNAVEMGGEKLNAILDKTGMSLRDLELLSANDSKKFKKLADSIGMTSTELNQFITAGTNLGDFAKVSGMSAEEFKKAWKDDAVGALTAFIKGLGDAENKGESAITMLTEMGLTEVRLRDSLLRAANAGDLFNNAIKTGTKAWEDNIALSKEVNKRYKTTESQLKMLKNEATKTAIEFGNELAPSLRQLIKDSKPLLNNISEAIKKFSQLDDKTKQNAIRLGALVVALGPTTKALGSLTSALGTGIKGVGNFAQALGNLKNGTNEGTESVKTLTGMLTSLGSPAGAIVGGTIAVAGLTTAIMLLHREQIEASKAAKTLADETSKQKQELDEYNKNIDEVANAELARINTVSKLKDELTDLADENGKVDEKNRGRVSFILNELNEALGTEYKLNGDIIESYKKLQDEIQGTIDKEKARIILNAKKSKYEKAREDNEKYTEKAAEARNAIIQKGFTPKELQEYLNKLSEYEHKGYTTGLTKEESNEYIKLFSRIGQSIEEEKALRNLSNAYSDSLYNLKVTTEAKKDYEKSYADFVEGKYEEINTTVTVKTENWCKKSLKELQNALNEQENNLETYKEIYINTQDEISSNNIKQTEINIKTLSQEMANRLLVVETFGKDEILAWTMLANSDYEVFEATLNKMSPEMQLQIKKIIGVINDESPNAENAMDNLSNNLIEKLKDNEEYRNTAISNLQGFLNGLSDSEMLNLLKQVGTNDAEEVMKGIRSGDLAEEEGINILDHLINGLNNTSKQQGVFSAARVLSSNLSSALSSRLNLGNSIDSGHADGLAYVPKNNYIARLHEGERVLTKKENQDYTRNINNNSQNVVVNIYPQTMTEQEMVKISKFIEREWGMKS